MPRKSPIACMPLIAVRLSSKVPHRQSLTTPRSSKLSAGKRLPCYLAQRVIALREENCLCHVHAEEGELHLSPHALLGLFNQLHCLLQQCCGGVHSLDIRSRIGAVKRFQGS